MDDLIEPIRAALADGATAEAKTAGATACRTILAALEPPPNTPPLTPEAIVAAATALRGVPVEQLLDVAIDRLRRAVPPGREPAHARPLQLQLVPVPPWRRSP